MNKRAKTESTFLTDAHQLTDLSVRRIAYAVLVGALLTSWIVWRNSTQHFEQLRWERFTTRAAELQDDIKDRMLKYEQVLRCGRALFQSSDNVTREEFQTYIEASEVQLRFPGIQAMGFTVVIPAEEKASYEVEIRDEGFTEFRIHPAGERETYTSIKYIEPFDWRNQRAFGYDMYSNPTRRKAMDRAAKTGLAAISGKITLVQETNNGVQAGILCYLPVYGRHKRTGETEEALPNLEGWIYAAFRCDDLMSGILQNIGDDLRLQIYDTDQIAEENLLFDSVQGGAPAVRQSASPFAVALSTQLPERNWTISVSSTGETLTTAESTLSMIGLAAGIAVSLLLFSIVHSIGRQREVALRLAHEMTGELEESHRRTRSILENASEAILSTTEDGRIVNANRAAQELFRCEESLNGRDIVDLFENATLQALTNVATQRNTAEAGLTIHGRRSAGGTFPCRVCISHVESDSGVSLIVIVRDETARLDAAKQLAETNRRLIAASHSAGKAEVATGVLHNVGNVLNSVNVSAELLRSRMIKSPVAHLSKVSDVICQHEANLGEFFTNDRRGQHLPKFLKELTKSFEADRDAQLEELKSLAGNMGHIKEIVAMQQSFAKKRRSVDTVHPVDLFEDAIKMNNVDLRLNGVEIVREFAHVGAIETRKHDVLQILINLIRNAKQAVEMSEDSAKTIKLALTTDDKFVRFEVTDSGVGIAPENLMNVFQHGYTTKKTGHGFGLHSCANTANELGGAISVESRGHNLGATFIVELPIVHAIGGDGKSAEPVEEHADLCVNV